MAALVPFGIAGVVLGGVAILGGLAGIGVGVAAHFKHKHHGRDMDHLTTLESFLAPTGPNGSAELRNSAAMFYTFSHMDAHDKSPTGDRIRDLNDGSLGHPLRFTWLAVDHDSPSSTVALTPFDWQHIDAASGKGAFTWPQSDLHPRSHENGLNVTGLYVEPTTKTLIWPSKDEEGSWFPNGTLIGTDANGTAVHGEWTANVTHAEMENIRQSVASGDSTFFDHSATMREQGRKEHVYTLRGLVRRILWPCWNAPCLPQHPEGSDEW